MKSFLSWYPYVTSEAEVDWQADVEGAGAIAEAKAMGAGCWIADTPRQLEIRTRQKEHARRDHCRIYEAQWAPVFFPCSFALVKKPLFRAFRVEG